MLRPSYLREVVGNNNLKECLKIDINAAKIKNTCLEHTLFQGYTGCGKTTLAYALSNEMGKKCHYANAVTIKKNKYIIEILLKAEKNDIIFIDEIHRLEAETAEFLYPIMEGMGMHLPRPAKFDAISKLGSKEPFAHLKVEDITIIGATTDIGLLPKPFVNRFKRHYFLKPYSIEDIKIIIKNNAIELNLNITQDGIEELATRCKNIPRIVNANIEWLRDYALSSKLNELDGESVAIAMDMRGIDKHGFDENDRMYLKVLKDRFNEVSERYEPIGIKALSSMTALTEETITKFVEPYLLTTGLVEISPKGRCYIDAEFRREQQEIDDSFDVLDTL